MLICIILKWVKRAYAFCSVSSGMKIRTSSALSHAKCCKINFSVTWEPEKCHRILKRCQTVKSAGQIVSKVQTGMRLPFLHSEYSLSWLTFLK